MNTKIFKCKLRFTFPQRSLLKTLCVLSLVSLTSCTIVDAWLTESGQVAKEEFNPRVALKKYEWFKDAAAELDRKRADISVMQKSLDELYKTYAGTKRADWAESDRSEQSQLTAELNGLRSSHNDLAAQYNAAMAKVNYDERQRWAATSWSERTATARI